MISLGGVIWSDESYDSWKHRAIQEPKVRRSMEEEVAIIIVFPPCILFAPRHELLRIEITFHSEVENYGDDEEDNADGISA